MGIGIGNICFTVIGGAKENGIALCAMQQWDVLIALGLITGQ